MLGRDRFATVPKRPRHIWESSKHHRQIVGLGLWWWVCVCQFVLGVLTKGKFSQTDKTLRGFFPCISPLNLGGNYGGNLEEKTPRVPPLEFVAKITILVFSTVPPLVFGRIFAILAYFQLTFGVPAFGLGAEHEPSKKGFFQDGSPTN